MNIIDEQLDGTNIQYVALFEHMMMMIIRNDDNVMIIM